MGPLTNQDESWDLIGLKSYCVLRGLHWFSEEASSDVLRFWRSNSATQARCGSLSEKLSIACRIQSTPGAARDRFHRRAVSRIFDDVLLWIRIGPRATTRRSSGQQRKAGRVKCSRNAKGTTSCHQGVRYAIRRTADIDNAM